MGLNPWIRRTTLTLGRQCRNWIPCERRRVTLLRLVRHGETDWNRLGLIQGRRDNRLNDVGRKQAAIAAEHLAGRAYDALVSSPLARASETAQIIASALRIETVEFDTDLIEQAWGSAEGQAWDAVFDRFPDGQIPGREPHSTLVRRAGEALRRIADRHVGGAVILVSHGGLINAVNRVASPPSDCRGDATNGSISDIRLVGSGELAHWTAA